MFERLREKVEPPESVDDSAAQYSVTDLVRYVLDSFNGDTAIPSQAEYEDTIRMYYDSAVSRKDLSPRDILELSELYVDSLHAYPFISREIYNHIDSMLDTLRTRTDNSMPRSVLLRHCFKECYRIRSKIPRTFAQWTTIELEVDQREKQLCVELERTFNLIETRSNINLRQIGDKFVIVECDNMHVVIDLSEVISYKLVKGGIEIRTRQGFYHTILEEK